MVRAKENTQHNILHWGGVEGDGTNDDTTGINQAIQDVAALGGGLFFPTGDYRTTDTISVPNGVSVFMEDGAKIQAEGAGDAVLIDGARERRFRLRVVKSVDRWFSGGETTSVGIRARNTFRTVFENPRVYGFGSAGLWLDGDDSPAAYNTIETPWLEDSLVNLRLTRSTSAGYANQNTFIGGQYRHTSSSLTGGAVASGSKEIECDGNGNVFYNASLEGANVERSIYCTAAYNTWHSCRFEVGPPIEFDNAGGFIPGNARLNRIEGGYAFLADDTSPGAGQPEVIDTGVNNTYYGHQGHKFWSSPNTQFAEQYALQLTTAGASAAHPALQIVNGEAVGGGIGTVNAEITHDGKIGVLDTAGVMRYLQKPTGPGPATWV